MAGILDALRRSELFSGLSDEQLKRVAELGEDIVFERGEIVVREGQPGEQIFIVRRGMVEVQVSRAEASDAAGSPPQERIVTLGPGQAFGEMAILDRGPRSATVRCVEDDTRLYAIPRQALMSLCEEDPRIGYLLMRNLALDLSFKLRHRNLRVRSRGRRT
jgi:CRP-like cAMP-binding protein